MTDSTKSLRVGDLFRCAKFADAVYATRWVGGDLVVDKRQLHFDYPEAHYTRTEKRPGGWTRYTKRVLDLRATDPSRATARFRVTKRSTAMGPPSCMGANDNAPSGHLIRAVRVDGPPDERIEFHTSSNFIDQIAECEIVEREAGEA